MWYNSTGKLRYSNNGWLVIDTHPSIVYYYFRWCEKLTWKKMSTPYHGAHITVIAGKYYKNISKHPNWGKYNNQNINFSYSGEITYIKQQDGIYYWLPVKCDALKKIRLELGLTEYNTMPYHLTVAFYSFNNNNNNNKNEKY